MGSCASCGWPDAASSPPPAITITTTISTITTTTTNHISAGGSEKLSLPTSTPMPACSAYDATGPRGLGEFVLHNSSRNDRSYAEARSWVRPSWYVDDPQFGSEHARCLNLSFLQLQYSPKNTAYMRREPSASSLDLVSDVFYDFLFLILPSSRALFERRSQSGGAAYRAAPVARPDAIAEGVEPESSSSTHRRSKTILIRVRRTETAADAGRAAKPLSPEQRARSMQRAMVRELFNYLLAAPWPSGSRQAGAADDLAVRHRWYGVSVNAYNAMGEALLQTLEYFVEPAQWTRERRHAWLSAYSWLLKELLELD